MKGALFILGLTVSLQSQAFDERWSHAEREYHQLLENRIRILIEKDFPELRNKDIHLRRVKIKNGFFHTTPGLGIVFKKKKNRVYRINYQYLDKDEFPSLAAVDAILVHELHHILGYTRMSGAKIGGLGIKYAFSKKFRRKYERETDYSTIDSGYGLGLIEFREWLEDILPDKKFKKKIKNYLTVEEIQDYMSSQS